MQKSLNEIVLRNLLIEREMAIASGNKERLDVLQAAIDPHLTMMQKEDANKFPKVYDCRHD